MSSTLLHLVGCKSSLRCITGYPLRLGGIIPIRNRSGLSYKHHVGSTPLKYVPLGATLSEAANMWPGRPAIISCHEKKTLTFSELLVESDRLAAALKNLGLEKGDRFGIWMPNTTQWVTAMMAASRSGLISVAINPMYKNKEMEYAIHKVGVKAIIAPGSQISSTHYKILAEIIPELPKSTPGKLKSTKFHTLKWVITTDPQKSPPGTISYDALLDRASVQDIAGISREMQGINPDSECNIQYTSGTTGNPKAVVLSHASIVNNGFCIGVRNELNMGHKKICVQVPLFHVFGVVVTISAAMQHGATMVFAAPKYSPKDNLQAIMSEKCNVIHGTPTMYIDLVNEVRTNAVSGVSSEVAVTGGAPVTPKLVKDMAKELNVTKVKSIYGLTETSAVTFQSLPGEDPSRPLDYLGFLHDHLEAKIVDNHNNVVPIGQPGELLTRGYSTMVRYWDDEEKTKETICEDRWLRSGDQAILHEDGYCKLVGRLKDLIIKGGENIAPKEIEDAISTHPDVLECQVFGMEDYRFGEEICAAVRIRDGAVLNEDSIKKHTKNLLSTFKVPKIVRQVESFPKTASGKVQKFKLKNLLESGQL